MSLQTEVADFLPFLSDFKNYQDKNLIVENLLHHGSALESKSFDKTRPWKRNEILAFLTDKQNLSQRDQQKTGYIVEIAFT